MTKSLPLETPSMSRRQLLNFLTGAVVATTATGVLYPVTKFFIAPTEILFLLGRFWLNLLVLVH
jgi:cytochrome b6-f complex iron-sulfur subunit